MPPSLDIPFAGLKLESHHPSTKSAPVPSAIGLSLSDGMIEDMIRCVQNGKPIELSLGGSPSLTFGNKTHNLSTYEDPFHCELYQSSDPTSKNTMAAKKQQPVTLQSLMFSANRLVPAGHEPTFKYLNLKTGKTTKVEPAAVGGDAALANLRNSMANEKAKKEGNTTKYIKDGLPVVGQRRGGAQSKVTNKSKFLSQNRGFSGDTTKSLPVSPALSGVGSPALGPTSKPLSQQQAEQAKSARKPIVHLLALEPMSEQTLQNKIHSNKDDFHQALSKVADLNSSTSKWELRKNYYKELDVFSFDYESEEDRQRVIDNAVKIFDKMRLGTSEPQWDKLLPKSERGTGKCLSKLQAQIAQGPVAKPKSSNRNSPFDEEEDLFGDKNKNLSKAKGEAMARSSSQPIATKPKKSEREAQTKRLLSKNPAKAAAATAKPKTAKTAAAAKKEAEKAKANNTKPLSSQFVSESDDEEVELKKEPVSKPLKKPSNKRLREEEVESSDSSLPLSKKSKANINSNNNHRISDSSQSSRPSSNSTSSSANSFKGKGTGNGNGNANTNGISPQKSSPLASSPPTNASESDNTPAGGRSLSSASPPPHTLTGTHNGRSPIHKRHQKSSSVTSSNSSSSSTRYLKAGVIHLAHKYKTFYPKYEALYRELAASGIRDESKEKDLLDMHERLSLLKQQILEGIVEE
ncbi:hypothetical protein ACMFMG_010805 [Clarireedia jacksonii]